MAALRDPRQEKFANLLASGRGPTESYKEAGYTTSGKSAKVAASRLRCKPDVEARVNEIVEAKLKIEEKSTQRAIQKLAITKEYVLGRLVENVERSMQAVQVLDKKGIPTGEYKYEGSVANKALELIGRELGMFIQRTEVGAPGEFEAVQDPAKMRELIAQRLSLAGPKLIEGEVIDDDD